VRDNQNPQPSHQDRRPKRRLWQFGIRSLLAVTVVVALPCWWIASQRSEWLAEQAVLSRMAPHVRHVKYQNIGPNWLWRTGYRPRWLDRAWLVDFAGYTAPGAMWTQASTVHPLDDDAFASLVSDLLALEHLEELHIELTRLSDGAIPDIRRFGHLRFINLQENRMTSDLVRDLDHEMAGTKIAFFYDQ